MRYLILLILFAFHQFAQAGEYKGCDEDSKRQKERSAELQILVKADQEDRVPPIDWLVVGKRDETRRKRVGEIFGEGCFSTAEDYGAAALIFQHGNLPEHAYQYTRMSTNKDCRCLQPVELSFSDQQRVAAGGTTINDAMKYVVEKNAGLPACKEVTFCDSNLKPSPRGTLPGIW